MIRVGVFGAGGRMGSTVCAAVADAPDMELVAAVDPAHAGERTGSVTVAEGPQAILDSKADVAVDFTQPDVVMDDIRWAISNGIHIVVGTTGITEQDFEEIRGLAQGKDSNVFVAPNFAIGAVLAQRLAAQAAAHFPAVEIIELHHDGKADAPSGTSLAAARAIAEKRGDEYRGPEKESLEGARGGDAEGIRIHSVRLPGLVAHQEIILGGPGQTLSIRHDSMDRTSFMPGVLMAIDAVRDRPGLTVGLDALLEE
ncbi:MAG: 4-hydroxy-tetrahydrodipicolinate reductase [Actinomycetota bacterium]